MRHYIGY